MSSSFGGSTMQRCIPSVADYFAVFYEGGKDELKERFSDADLERMTKKGMPPLNLPEEDGWRSAWKPFSFDIILRLVTGRVSDVLLRSSEKGEALQILEYEDGVETCLKKLSESKEIFYNVLCEAPESRRWEVDVYEKEAEHLYDLLAYFIGGQKRCAAGGYLVPDVSHLKLSLCLYGRHLRLYGRHQKESIDATESYPQQTAFYKSLFNTIEGYQAPPNPGDSNDKGDGEYGTIASIEGEVRECALYVREEDSEPVAFGFGDAHVVVKGLPCKKSLFDDDKEKKTRWAILNPLFVTKVETQRFESFAYYEGRRFSRTVSALCHLELFGSFLNEEDVAVSRLIFEDPYVLRLHELTSAHISRRPRRGGDGGSGTEDGDYDDRGNPYYSLKWICDGDCMLRGSRFGERFYPPVESVGGEEEEDRELHCAFSYAYLSHALSHSLQTRGGLSYFGRPLNSRGYYEWRITKRGMLYYKKNVRPPSSPSESNNGKGDEEEEGEKYMPRKKRARLIAKDQNPLGAPAGVPFFMNKVGDGDDKTALYLGAAAMRGDEDGLFRHLPIPATTTAHDHHLKRAAAAPPAKTKRPRREDPGAWRRYDGLGKFPTLCSRKEVESETEGDKLLYDSDRNERDDVYLLNRGVRCKAREIHGWDREHRLYVTCDLLCLYFSIVSSDLSARDVWVRDPSLPAAASRDIPYADGLRSVDFRSLCCEAKKILHRSDRQIKATWPPREHDWSFGNPLWMQCCAYLLTERLRLSTVCRTFENVPKSLDEFCFALNYEGRGRRDHVVVLCYVSRDCDFRYALFWVDLDLTQYGAVASKVDVWEIVYEDDDVSCGGEFNEASNSPRPSRYEEGRDYVLDQDFKMIRKDLRYFDALLNRSVLFLINDEL